MLTAKQFIKVLEKCENNGQWDELIYELHCGSVLDCDLTDELRHKGYELSFKQSYGGEDMGSEYWVVFGVTHNGVETCFRLNGWYASYSGGHFENRLDFERVESRPVTVHQWFTT
jgi:hypothetical protein